MDLEVVGRHALLFDDDNSASFVNSVDALVEWNSLSIDRYDVRHLLSAPLPPRTRRRQPHPDASLEPELDRERYLDLPSPSDEQQQEQDTGNNEDISTTGGYHSVAFAYGNPDESTELKSSDTEPVFHPAFPVPETLIHNLPPTEKIHLIIARTATFVAKHGGQSEIVLRVKQGDNPMFGFLMPDHHLHAYFRFLVDHQELLKYDTPGVSLVEEKKNNDGLDRTGGALSLLGSIYGSGEDDDDTTEDASDLPKVNSQKVVDAISATLHGSEHAQRKESSENVTGKDDNVSKSCSPLKENVYIVKHNHISSAVKGGVTSKSKKGSDTYDSMAANKSQAPTLSSASNVELPILEPPSDQRRVVEKIVEFILKNGREFEAVLAEQNCKQGRFLFLLPTNQYHSYYLKVLQDAQEPKLHCKGLISKKHESVGHVLDKKSTKGDDALSSGSAGQEIPFDYDRKEKFKMVIGKSKKDGEDQPSKSNQPEVGVSLDAAAAILQAARRGIKNPGLDVFTKPASSGAGQGSSNEGGRDLSSGSQTYCPLKPNIPVPVAKAIAETAALAAAGEADSSEASLTKEQKLKAERLKRAKMFAAMIKGGSAPLKTESMRGVSVEPPEYGVSSSGNEVVNLVAKEREGSSAPLEVDISEKIEEYVQKFSNDESNDRRAKKAYRTLSKRLDEEEEGEHDDDLERGEKENKEETKKDHKHSRKKHRSHHSSDYNKDRHRHRRHSASKDRESSRFKHVISSDEKHRHSRRKHKDNNSDDERQPTKRHKYHSSSDDEHWHPERQHTHREHRTSKRRHKHSESSDTEHRHSWRHHNRGSSSENEHRHQRSLKHRESESEKEMEVEEGEILPKSDQSIVIRGAGGGTASREASVGVSNSDETGRASSQPSRVTEVSDDLRAKIRAMLMATL